MSGLTLYRKYRKHKAIAWSDLKVLIESPTRFAQYKFEKDDKARHKSSGYSVGDLVDCLVYEPDELWKRFVLKPDDMVEPSSSPNKKKFYALMKTEEGTPSNWYKQSYAESGWKKLSDLQVKEKAATLQNELAPYSLVDNAKDRGLSVISDAELTLAKIMINSLKTDKLINRILFQRDKWDIAEDQFPIIGHLDVPDGTILAKCLLDSLRVSFKNKSIYVGDLKTTRRAIGEFNRDYFAFGYHAQLGFYGLMAMKYLIAKKIVKDPNDWKIYLINFVVQNVPYYESVIFEMTEETMDKAILRVHGAIKRYIHHRDKDEWKQIMEASSNRGMIPI